MWSHWAYRDEPDPLSDPINLTDVSFVAFLWSSVTSPIGYEVDVQGLFVSCVGSAGPAINIIEPLPDDAAGLSIDELIDEVNGPPLEFSGEIAVGETRVVRSVNTHCGVERLLVKINDQWWKATDIDKTDATGIDLIPSAWRVANQNLDLEITLVDPTTLDATVVGSGVTVTYQPDESFVPCN